MRLKTAVALALIGLASQAQTISAPPPLVVTTTSLPSGVMGQPYSANLSATGGKGAYHWSVTSGSLPAGLRLDGGDGTISGTPSSAGTSNFIVTVKDKDGTTASQALALTIADPAPPPPPPALAITTTSLPGGSVGTAYSATLTATGGVPPYLWSTNPLSLPPGVILNPTNGKLSGTPIVSGAFTVAIQVIDSALATATQNYTITIGGGVSLITTSLPNGTVGTAYNASLTATGGQTPYTWSAASLPPGLSIDAQTGNISGTPTTAGQFSVALRVTDANGSSASQSLNITIAPPPLSITTGSLPGGTTGAPYSATLAATGGVPPYTWGASSLPPGVTVNAQTGVIAGTPTSAGSYNVSATVTDSANATANRSYAVTIIPGVTITTASLPSGTASKSYTASLAASGGTPPYSWVVSSGTLPAGLTLSSGGQISGTPTAAGSSSFTVRATDSGGSSATQNLSISIAAAAAPLSISGSLGNGTVGSPYAGNLSASGGTPPYTWSVSAGNLPPGLTLPPGGGINGIPSAAGTYSFTVQVADSAGATITKQFTVGIANQLSIKTASLPGAALGPNYSQTLSASGGFPPYSWSVVSGQLPPGLTLNPSSGVISGTTTTAGTYTFTIQVSDSTGASVLRSFTIAVASNLTITSTSPLPPASVGSAYSQALAAISGVPPYTWRISAGSLPPGIALASATGLLSGTPATAGSYTFTVQVTDASSASVSKPFTLTVLSALTITTTTLPGGTVGVGYSQQLSAVAGTSPYTWSVSSGALPPGITLSTSGLLSGTPSASGAFTFTVKVTDAVGQTATQPLTLNVASALGGGGTTLPGATVGQPYSQTLNASGGTPPYTFKVSSGALPAGLTLSSSGALSGTPTAAGTFQFGVQVTDAAGAVTTVSYSLVVNLSGVAEVSITGLPATTAPMQQVNLGVTLAKPYAVALTGSLTLTFQPDAVIASDDAAVQFSNGSRTANFTIPAGATQAEFSSPLQLQTGSTAGAITVTAQLSAAGGNATPNPAPSSTATIPRSAPVIRALKLVKTATGFEVWITGYSPTRELTQASFQFSPVAGSDLATLTATVSLADAAKAWYQDAGSKAYGSQFTIVQPFTITGNTNAVSSVSVMLANSVGTSQAMSGGF